MGARVAGEWVFCAGDFGIGIAQQPSCQHRSDFESQIGKRGPVSASARTPNCNRVRGDADLLR